LNLNRTWDRAVDTPELGLLSISTNVCVLLGVVLLERTVSLQISCHHSTYLVPYLTRDRCKESKLLDLVFGRHFLRFVSVLMLTTAYFVRLIQTLTISVARHCPELLLLNLSCGDLWCACAHVPGCPFLATSVNLLFTKIAFVDP